MKLGALAASLLLCGCASSRTEAPADASADVAIESGPLPVDAGADVVPKGARTLGLDVRAAVDDDFLAAFARARDAGAESVNVTIDWRDLETLPDAGPDGGDAGPTYFHPSLHIANLVFSGQAKVSLAIRAVARNGSVTPPDLASRPLDDPAVVSRYEAALDYVFGEIPDLQLSMLALGEEVDVPFGSDAAKWSAYARFFDGAAAHARSLRAKTPVGTVVTAKGALGAASLVADVANGADYLGLTYSPVNDDFTARVPAGVRADFEALARLYPGTPLYIREASYPSSGDVGSSPEAQAAFVDELFAAWDAFGREVPLVTFAPMTDPSPAALSALVTYYGGAPATLSGYLGSRGLRTFGAAQTPSGSDKPAWVSFAAAAHARAW